MEKVRYGIIGVGNMGTGHAGSLTKGLIEDAVLTAVCDINPDKLKSFEEKFGTEIAQFTSATEMISSGLIDCVIVAVPHYDHPRLSIEALNAGLNVICEKPAGVYTKQVEEMNAVAEKSDKIFALMFNQRTNPYHIKMREMVQDGVIGEIKRVNWIITTWYRTQSYYDSGNWRATWAGEGGGVLFNQCPHQIDLLQWIVGMMPSSVRSFCHFGKWHDIEVEDDVTAYMEFPNGATGCFITSTGDTPGSNRFEILGTKGKIVYENNVITLTTIDTDERVFVNEAKGGFDEPKKETTTITLEPEKLSEHQRVLTNVTNAILGKDKLFIDGKEGIRGVTIADAMLLSTWLDKKIEIPFDGDLYLSELNKRRATSRLKTGAEKTFDLGNSFSIKK